MLPRSLDSLHLDTADVEHPTGAPVLCLHGLFAGSWVFEQLLPLLAARGYPAAALSFRGHPPNAPIPRLGRQGITDYCADATLAARALDRPIIIGHSLGGLVALLLAGRNLARAAILVSPAPPRGISVFSAPLLARMARYIPALLFSRPFLPNVQDLDALVLNRVLPEDRAALRARLVPDSGRAARQAALGVYKVPPRAMRAPLLVIGAEHDRFIPLRAAERVAELYASPFHVARGHGHFLFGEPGWEDQANVMLNWMDALPRVIRDASAEVRARPGRPHRSSRQ